MELTKVPETPAASGENIRVTELSTDPELVCCRGGSSEVRLYERLRIRNPEGKCRRSFIRLWSDPAAKGGIWVRYFLRSPSG
jgi:hypothetical protein